MLTVNFLFFARLDPITLNTSGTEKDKKKLFLSIPTKNWGWVPHVTWGKHFIDQLYCLTLRIEAI